MTSIKQAITFYSKNLTAFEIRLFLQRILVCSLEELLLGQDNILSKDQNQILANFCYRRLSGEPLAYIIESKEFFGLEFKVNKDVLIPRPETELIVEEALSFCGSEKKYMLDMATGSGCIAISIASSSLKTEIVAVDISKKALALAKENAEKYRLTNRIKFIRSNWFQALPKQKFDLIICNPPYIPPADSNIMAEETLKYEPHLALFAANDGLEPYYILAKEAVNYLVPDGRIIVECGYNQADRVSNIFKTEGLLELKRIKDLSGFDRCLVFGKQ